MDGAHLHSGLDGDGRDLLDDLRGGVQVDDALVDAHLEAVPGLGTLTARGLAGGDAQHLGGQADGAGHLALEALVLRTALQVGAHLLQRRDVLGRQGDADAVHLGLLARELLALDSRHFVLRRGRG